MTDTQIWKIAKAVRDRIESSEAWQALDEDIRRKSHWDWLHLLAIVVEEAFRDAATYQA